MLVPLPAQPEGLAWPTDSWPRAELGADVDRGRLAALLDRAFVEPQPQELGRSLAVVAIQKGALVAERYAEGVDETTTLISWSMAKSILHAVFGILVREGRIDIHLRAPVPEWSDPDDPRHAISVDQLLRMSPGLRFNEDYVDAEGSDCIRMLFGLGKQDVAAYAASFPLEKAPDEICNYSSGTTNILARIAGDLVGDGQAGMEAFLRRELFAPLGMTSAKPRFDTRGTWIASSYVFATARDFARFGLLYLRDGVWEKQRLLPAGWVDYARTRTPASTDEEPYGAHWWLGPLQGRGSFWASGYRGQRILVVPSLDLVVVRLGETEIERAPEMRAWLAELVDSLAGNEGGL